MKIIALMASVVLSVGVWAQSAPPEIAHPAASPAEKAGDSQPTGDTIAKPTNKPTKAMKDLKKETKKAKAQKQDQKASEPTDKN
jgi:hypothetical protein